MGKDATNQRGRLTKKFFITPQLVASFASSVQAAKVMDHPLPPCSPDLAPVNLLFSQLKKELGGFSIVPESFEKERCRPLMSTMKEELGTAFVR